MKSCLKSNQPTPASSPGPEGRSPSTNAGNHCKSKCVAFCPNSQEVWEADDWDRTPTEPVKNLSYQDMLELKEIQKSLPRAAQPIDMSTRRPFSNQYLCKVPVGLLPLLQTDEPCSAGSPLSYSPRRNNSPVDCNDDEEDEEKGPKPPVTYSAPSSLFPRGFAIKKEQPPPPPIPSFVRPYQPPQHVPSHLAHLIPTQASPQPRKRATFTFLPLLEDPTPKVEEDPPTPSLTNASLDSSPNPSPRSQASDLPDAPLSAHHTPDYHYQQSYFPPFEEHHEKEKMLPVPPPPLLPPVMAFKRMNLAPLPSPALVPPSPLSLNTPPQQPPQSHVKEVKRRKKQVIYINDMEVELDEDEPDSNGTPCSPCLPLPGNGSGVPRSPISPSSPRSHALPSSPPRLKHGFQFLPVNGPGSPPTPVSSPLPLSRMGCATMVRRSSSPSSGNMAFVGSA